MKNFILALLIALAAPAVALSPSAHAEPSAEAALCATRTIHTYRPVIDQPQYYDKYKHCSMSCVLALHCGPAEALTIGILKEIYDVFTPGDSDYKDYLADKWGVELIKRRFAKSPQECYQKCDRRYPKSTRPL